jgi:hypothetical protein
VAGSSRGRSARRHPHTAEPAAYPPRVTSRVLIALAASGCGLLPPDASPRAPAADPDAAALVHAWHVDAHLLSKRTSLSDADATHHHGSPVSVGRTGYTTPWHGTCEESGLTRRDRPLAEVAAELAIERPRVLGLGFTDPLAEYHLSCLDLGRRTPALTLYVANARALLCYSGACYVLVH